MQLGELGRCTGKCRLEQLMDLSMDAYLVFSLKGKILYANPAARWVLGYYVCDKDVQYLLEKVHPQSKGGVLKAIGGLIQGRQARGIRARFRVPERPGAWLEWDAICIPEHEQIYVNVRDISKKVRLEEELRATTREIEATLERISDAFFAIDSEGRLTFVNSPGEEMAGKSREELLGKRVWDVFSQGGGSELRQQMDKALVEGVPVHFETNSFSDPNRVLSVHLYPDQEGLSIFSRDITDAKIMEQKLVYLERLKMIGKVAAGLGHELRNPLAALRGTMQLLDMDMDQVQRRVLVSSTLEELDRANSVLTQFLTVAQHEPVYEAVCLRELISNLLPGLQHQAGADGKYVEAKLDTVPRLQLDVLDMQKLVTNLVKNGLEAMSPGGVVRISLGQVDDSVVLEVADGGVGIDPEILESLGHGMETTKASGVGLGLAVCYGIAARHRAGIHPSSGPDGTRIQVKFSQG